ncbi:hypothetical protein MBLNU230_g4758t1 [Neophaeotheca triangularis]
MALLNRDSPVIATAKALTITSTLYAASSIATTTTSSIPTLLLATAQPPTSTNSRRPQTNRMESGRLTPRPETNETAKQLGSSNPATALNNALNASSDPPAPEGYKLASQQFLLLHRASAASQLPAEILAVAASGYLAYAHRALGTKAWVPWAVVAGLVGSVFPVAFWGMRGEEVKLSRMAGEREGVEPYEDSPPDWEMERGNTEGFLRRWRGWNAVRGALVGVAGVVGIWGVVG